MTERRFATFAAAVRRAIPNASHAEIDTQYQQPIDVEDAIRVIRRARGNRTSARRAMDSYRRARAADDHLDWDYSMNG